MYIAHSDIKIVESDYTPGNSIIITNKGRMYKVACVGSNNTLTAWSDKWVSSAYVVLSIGSMICGFSLHAR